MEEKDLEYFTQLLNTQLAELENRTKYTDIREMTQNNGLQDPLDIASSDMEKNMLLRIRERESRLISKIKQALELIAEGTYGTCEICGDDIPVKRLEARPVTTQCIECKTREELIERIRQNK
ncbi:MAG: RNA polymerase-binding protein DksA [Desulfobacteraceae bacterium]|nr:MAG: RNA polymerase-binding protein DksA [Desulfobacteraceae bacterium]